MNDPSKYGVQREKKLNTKNMSTGTDFRDALKHYLQPYGAKYSPGSPPGGHIFIGKLRKFPETNSILNEWPVKETPPSVKQRLEKRIEKGQTGRGIIKAFKKHSKISKTFKPQLWMKK